MSSKPCSEETSSARPGMPQVYYPLHSLLHTLRALETHQDQICTLLADIQRSGKVNASLRSFLRYSTSYPPLRSTQSSMLSGLLWKLPRGKRLRQ